ncbi:hypothetical protein ACF3NG_09670 [Aerococcaceae bacterium WGS1372]
MKNKWLYWLLGGITVLSLFSSLHYKIRNNHKNSVFSWFDEPLIDPKTTLNNISDLDIDTLYQFFSSEYFDNKEKQGQLEQLLLEFKEHHKDVYLLNGEAEWALDPESTELIKYINKTHEFLATRGSHSLIQGIIIDIEPQTLEEYQTNPDAVMASFTKGLKKAYEVVHELELKVIVCLPYYLDTEGYLSELETIIAEASDEVAIMNYYRDLEIEHIATEVALSQKYNKPIQTIYELQAPGIHGLTEMNTYYHLGITAVNNNFEQLRTYYRSPINLSYHELNSLIELKP